MQPVVQPIKACPRVVVWLQVHGWDVAYSAIESVENKCNSNLLKIIKLSTNCYTIKCGLSSFLSRR